MKKIIYLLIITFLLLQSCSNGDSNSSDNVIISGKLKRIHLIPSESQQQFIDFFYDLNGKLIKETTTNVPDGIITKNITFLRNENGDIINKFEVINTNNTTINTNFTIDNNGFYLTSTETKTISGNSTQTTANYIYTNNKISEINFSNGHRKIFTYDANENCIQVNDFYDGLAINYSTVTNYDNKINPFPYDDILLYNIGNNNWISSNTTFYDLSNNVTALFQESWVYSYNSNDKPNTGSYTNTYSQPSISSSTSSGACEFFYY
jgi:hypothetical protein